ncbi:MAG: hypothetical protein QXK06_05135 [Candidatus Diapherotrites archaeon]
MKKNLCIALATGILLLLFSSASAFDESHIKTWNDVYLVREMTMPVTVQNTSLQEKELKALFIGPAGLHYTISSIPEKIKPMESATFYLTIFPSDETEGTIYNSSLMVSLGETTVLKEIRVHSAKYFPIQETQPNETQKEEQKNSVTPLAALGGIEGLTLIFLIAIIILLSIAIIAKIITIKSRQEREFYG